MILIYTHKVTPRVRYIFKHIFTRILQVQIDFTGKVEEFVAYNGPKFSYTNVPLGKEFFVQSNELLFQQGIKDIEIVIQNWDEVPCFFPTVEASEIPFDIFAASFFLISRYEEYLPHIKDKYGRFTVGESIAYQNGFLEKPMVDIWAYKFLETLKQKFPDFKHITREYQYISTIDVDNAYAYKYKSFIRTIGGFLKDVSQFKVFTIWDRFTVFFNLKKDPFNTFQKIIELKKAHNVRTIFFFLIGDYTTFDTNVSASKRKFKLLIKDMVDYARVGLHPSYYTMNDSVMLKKEKERLETITNIPVKRSRQHYLRVSLPETYQQLIDLEIDEDYSMGYATHVGFRASTCTPFYFYDLDFEIQTPLKIFPFALMDTTLNDYMKLTPKQSLGKIRDLKNEVKAVNGTFITVFHNESLSNYLRWRGWSRLYNSMLKIVGNV
ncbi:polysaccharide deacetylase family protein [Tenacibaculum sp. 1B UA]|uniref:polysaccharide deacetylase family protein n=1 Tax=unclassified Tenacibaculum TaxID=2635139 RepID=UPI0026E22C03|nr:MULTISPECIES: polysaccharide deacetylase family protein [unclassified Tenacibaculum]MDO6674865.1 polysaccharide deacetylase family protein [Tenacibaculum sp. 1_MG-2023]MDX8553190.1 polysaccharide deacetylase family protein [Tenacibaculum sp. 1B UA]